MPIFVGGAWGDAGGDWAVPRGPGGACGVPGARWAMPYILFSFSECPKIYFQNRTFSTRLDPRRHGVGRPRRRLPRSSARKFLKNP